MICSQATLSLLFQRLILRPVMEGRLSTTCTGAISALASISAVIMLSPIMGFILLSKRLWQWLSALVFAVAAGIILNIVLKDFFDRARPDWTDPAFADAGFPSGHTMMVTLLYGFLSAYLILGTRSWPARIFIAVMTIIQFTIGEPR